jgi:hypothetical protein
MNGKKARTIRRLFGVKHVHNVPSGDRWMFRYVLREKRPGDRRVKITNVTP